MFARGGQFNIFPHPDVVHVNSHITEERAPTDKSVQLLREMEYAAEQKIISSVRVANTTFECVVHEWIDATNGHDHCWRAIFCLNGKDMTASYTGARGEDAAWVMGLRDAIAKEIASQILLATLK